MTKFFISPGDPAGIGPEITLKALSTNPDLQDKFESVIKFEKIKGFSRMVS